MKKIFTLFTAALIGLCAYAQSCPTRMEMHLLNGEDPANVTFEFELAQNNSLNLAGFSFFVNVPFTMVDGEAVSVEYGDNGFMWKKALGNKYVTAQGYAPYILERLEEFLGVEPGTYTDEEKESMLGDLIDNISHVQSGTNQLIFFQTFKTNSCRFYPNHAGKVGMGKMDMSQLADGEYVFVIENNDYAVFSYSGGDEPSSLHFDDPVIMTLVKANGVVTEGNNTPEPPVEYSEFYVVGTFNGWNQTEEGGRIELVENADGTQYIGEVQLEDGAEFKIITPVEDGWKWFGGVDENQVGYFEINDNLLDQPIELIDGSNFKVVGDGKYTITVMQPATPEGRAVAEPLVMTVSKEATGISTIETDKADNRIFDLQGRELKSVPENGVYIQNGKKYVK
ncbi:MAG: hypothetical protein IKW83_09680 [Muribaculaceae bacterium]|nr:hypothetical protein [Muribaculaceae bacterium]